MHIQADVPLFRGLWFAGMHPHAHTYVRLVWPASAEERALSDEGCLNRVNRTLENHEESIALGIDFVAVPLLKCHAQQVPALFEHAGITLAQPLEQARGPLDVGEEQRHGAGWKLAHCIPPRFLSGAGRKMYTPMIQMISRH